MANPQLEDGYIRIANEIWDQIMIRDFTKRQRNILDLVLRLSYGCGSKYAVIPTLNAFSLAGIRPNHVRGELEKLEQAGVLSWDRSTMHFEFNKRYSKWKIPVSQCADEDKLSELIALNLSGKPPKKGTVDRAILPKTGTSDTSIVPKTGTIVATKLPVSGSQDDQNSDDTSQNGKRDFPKQEVRGSQNRKSVLPKMGTSTPSKRHSDAGFRLPKDSIKDKLKTSKESKLLSHSFSPGMKRITEHYRNRIGMIGPSQYESLRFWHEEKKIDADAVCHAIDLTVDQAERPGMSYIEAILRNWFNDGVITLEDIKKRARERDGPASTEGRPNATAYAPVDSELVARWKSLYPEEYD